MHTHTRTHAHTVEDHRTARANTRRGDNAESRARAQIRTARICSWAHGRYRRGGSPRMLTVETAAESRLPTDPIRATHACRHLRYRTQSGDAVTRRYPPRQAWPNCPSHLAIYARRSKHKQTRIHSYVIHRQTNTLYAHTHGCAGGCVRAGGVRESDCKGEGRRGPWSICRDSRPCAAVASSAARPSGCNM